jgi:hypothetical protein
LTSPRWQGRIAAALSTWTYIVTVLDVECVSGTHRFA